MRPRNQLATGLALAALISLPAIAQERGAIQTATTPAAAAGGADWDGDGLGRLIHCLRVVNLTDAQRAAIQQFIEAEKPTLQSLHDTRKTDRETLKTDASAVPPDPCAVGNDFLKVRSDGLAIDAEVGKIKDFIVGQLTSEQKARFEGCIEGHSSTAAGASK